MGIKMDLSASNTQASSVSEASQGRVTAYESALTSIDSFSSERELKGQAYDSAQTYAKGMFMPLFQAAMLFEEGLTESVNNLPSRYTNEVSSESLDQDTLQSQIDAYDQAIVAQQSALDEADKRIGVSVTTKESIQSSIDMIQSKRDNLQQKLDKLITFDANSPSIFDSVDSLKSALSQALTLMTENFASFNGTFILPSMEKMEWTQEVNKQWLMKKRGMNEKQEELALEFYNSLPQEVRKYVTVDDIEATDDGFVMLNKPFSEILKAMGKTEVDLGGDIGVKPVDEVYDDHFIYGVRNGEQFVFSILKMRESGDSVGSSGVSIPFISTRLDSLFTFSDKDSRITTEDYFFNEFQRIVDDSGQEADSTLVNYFKKTESKAPYLIADVYTNKLIADNSGQNTFSSEQMKKLVAKINQIDEVIEEIQHNPTIIYPYSPSPLSSLYIEKSKLSRIPDYLNSLNNQAGYQIYNPDTGEVTIKDPQNPTHYERQALLAINTANVNYNSFAAEVEYHADAIEDWVKNNWISNFVFNTKERAIRADMALGEESESGIEDKYYNLEDSSVQSQKEAHGEL